MGDLGCNMADAENPKMEDTVDKCEQVKVAEAGEGTVINASTFTNPLVIEALKSQLKNQGLGGICGTVIPKYLKKKVKALKKLQLEHVNLEVAFYREMHELEVKYEKSFSPLYEKRKLIVSGAVEPTPEECDFPSDSEKDISEEMDDMKIEDAEEQVTDVKGVPDFWLTAFKNATVIADIIEDHDEPILKHLFDVRAIMDSDPLGFMLEFHFEPNEHFSNSVLTKYYEMKCVPDPSDPFTFDGPEIVKSKGCNIDWKKGMNVTIKTIKKKQKHRARGAVRMVTRTVQNDSFFNFFNPPTVPIDEEEEMDEDQRNSLTADFEIGNYIKDNVIPQAVLYFTGENLVDDEFDEDDDDEDEEFDEDDEDSENEGQNLVKRKNVQGNIVQQALAAQPPTECKQQ